MFVTVVCEDVRSCVWALLEPCPSDTALSVRRSRRKSERTRTASKTADSSLAFTWPLDTGVEAVPR